MAVFLRFGPIYVLANLLTTVRFVVQGDSMQPNFAGDQYILVSRLTYVWDGPSRGDVVVVVQHPLQRGRNYIKRIVGLPGESVRIEEHRVFINGLTLEEPYLDGPDNRGPIDDPQIRRTYDGNATPNYDTESAGGPDRLEGPDQEWSLSDDEYFMIGDNRANSDDSRSFGPLKRDLIVGKAWIRYWPRNVWGVIR